MKLKIRLAIAALCLFLAGCSQREIVEVRVIEVHIYGTSPAKDTWSERFTYMTAERLDTKERRNFVQVLGQPGEVFKMNWYDTFYR